MKMKIFQMALVAALTGLASPHDVEAANFTMPGTMREEDLISGGESSSRCLLS